MKLTIKIICLALCMLFVVGSMTCALSDNEGLYAFVKTNRAALYTKANMSSRSRYLYKYDLVTILESNGTKTKVQYGGKTGYIYTKYLTVVTPINETMYISRDTKVYSRPYTTASKQAISRNTRVNVLMYSSSWAMIEKDGYLAYVQKAFLSAEALSDATPPSDKQWKTDYSLSGNVVECDLSAYVTVSSLSVYSKASTSSTKLGTLKKSTMVNVYAYNATWAYIELNGRYGYCKWAYLKKADAAPTPTPTPTAQAETFTEVTPFDAVANAKIQVYETWSEQSKYLGYVSEGTTVQVLAYSTNWAKISLNGKTGYTLKSGLSIPTATPTPTVTPSPTPLYASTDEIFLNTSTTNEQKIYEYLTSRTTYNEAVACGILANIKQESNFNPNSGKGSNYQGLCQWSKSRFAILESWCEKQGYNPYSLEGQIKFLWYDLSERYTVYHKALSAIENTSEGAYEAGYYFCYYYERPSALESSSVKRATKARDVYWVKYAH